MTPASYDATARTAHFRPSPTWTDDVHYDPPMTMIRDGSAEDAPGMLEIYAPVVRDTAISFETEPPSVETFGARVEAARERHAWVVAEGPSGAVLGYAYAGSWRTRAAYRWTAEVAIYVRDTARVAGVGRQLYAALFERLRARGYVTLVAGITLPNEASVRFHEACGFRSAGVVPCAGYKLGSWHDVGFWWRTLRETATPPQEPL